MQKEYIVKKTSSLSINVVATEVESLRKVVETTSTVRVYDNGNIGVAGQVGNTDWATLEQQAIDNLSLGIDYPCELTRDTVKEQNTQKDIVDTNRFVQTAKDLLSKLKEEIPDFLFSNKIQYREDETTYKNTQNTSLKHVGNEMDIILCVKSKQSANIIDFAYSIDLDCYDPQKVVDDLKALCTAFNNNIPLENGKYVVVASQNLFYGNIVEHLAGESYATGASLFKGMLGQTILSDKISLGDDREHILNVPFFDAEGTLSSDANLLVENGKFVRVIANKKIAKKFNLPGAFGSVAQYDSIPTSGAIGLRFKNTADRIEDIIGEKAIYILDASGGDMTTSGDFATPCQVALLVENGKFVGRVPQINLFGNVKDFLGDDFIGASDKGLFRYDTPLAVAKMNITTI